jgi:hypothetical protein
VADLIACEPDLQIADDVEGDAAGICAAESTAARFFITGCDDLAPGAVCRVMRRVFGARLIVLSTTGAECVMYEARPVRRVLGELSQQTLLAAIRERSP